jgi:hypothetical protein
MQKVVAAPLYFIPHRAAILYIFLKKLEYLNQYAYSLMPVFSPKLAAISSMNLIVRNVPIELFIKIIQLKTRHYH